MTPVTHKIPWNTAHYLWNDFKLGDDYKQYLQDTYGITVENGGRAIWNHVFTVEIVVRPGAAGEDVGGILGNKKKKGKKKIKLIFIMGESHKEIEKEVKDIIPIKAISDIKNKIEEQLQTKISLSDVQIIKG